MKLKSVFNVMIYCRCNGFGDKSKLCKMLILANNHHSPITVDYSVNITKFLLCYDDCVLQMFLKWWNWLDLMMTTVHLPSYLHNIASMSSWPNTCCQKHWHSTIAWTVSQGLLRKFWSCVKKGDHFVGWVWWNKFQPNHNLLIHFGTLAPLQQVEHLVNTGRRKKKNLKAYRYGFDTNCLWRGHRRGYNLKSREHMTAASWTLICCVIQLLLFWTVRLQKGWASQRFVAPSISGLAN